MKKLGKALYYILSFFDKILITPITKLFLKISDLFKSNTKSVERFLNKKQTLIIISLLFAVIVFFIVDSNSNSIINNSAEILYNQKVTAEYNEEAYVIEGIPETVDVTLIGRKSYLYLAKQYSANLQVSVDLTDLKPGRHKVSLKTSQGLDSIDYKIDPSTATVVIYEKISESRELTSDLLHKDSLDSKLVINNVDLNRNDCIIKGAEYKLKQVATVKALIDIDNINNPKEGTTAIKDIPLVAYDASGNVVDVEIVPGTVDAGLVISSPSKQVPLKVIPTGDLAFGKSINKIDSSVSTVTIFGDQESLDKIDSIPVEIDVTNLSSNKEFNVNIAKPSGVRDMSAKTVTIKVTIDSTVSKEFDGIRIQPVNLGSGYKAQAAGEDSGQVTVIAKGSQEVINSISENISSIKATVDLSGLGEGTYEVDVDASGSDVRATYESKKAKVKIIITKSN